MSTHRCPSCGLVLPWTAEYFTRDNRAPSGFTSHCKKCRNKLFNDRGAALRAKRLGLPTSISAPKSAPIAPPNVSIAPIAPQPRQIEETIDVVTEHRLKKRVRELEEQHRHLTERLSENGEYSTFVSEVLAKQQEAPPATIAPRERTSNLLEATPLVLASDWHVEEQVKPEQVAGRNRYDLDISTRRMERFFEAFRWAMNHQRDVFKIRDAILWLGGDFMTNFLHEDDVENNLLPPLDAALFLQRNLIKGIDFLLEDPEIEQYILPMNDGNHGRLTKKMRSATRADHSLEVFLYAQLAMHYRNEPRLRFILPTSQFTFLDNIYGRTIRFLHGDVFKYGGGVGGITVPLFRAMSRWEKVKHADLTCMGHWHQRYCLPDVMVNGCFESGTRVLTLDGPRAIETIAVGDQVLSRDGTIQTVENTLSKTTNDLVRLRAKGLPNEIVCTPNHEFWAIKGESSNTARPGKNSPRAQTTILEERPSWYRAEHLSEGDWVHTPHLKGTSEMPLDLLFAYGVFMAEGHTVVNGGATGKHNRIEFSMHIEELHILEQIKKTLDRELGGAGRLWVRTARTTSHLSYSGREVAARFRADFGHTSRGKKVPSWMFELTPQCRQAVVQGWIEGDGHRGKCTTASSVSEQLAWGMNLLAVGTGLEPMLYVATARNGGPRGACHVWRVSFVEGQDVRWVNGERFLRIDFRRRERRDTVVHDLQVSGEHTYCVEGVGVHNSLIGYNAYAMGGGFPYEPPVQSLRMLEPKRWCSSDIPLWVSELADDALSMEWGE